MLYLGCKIGYWRGDIKGLVDDIGEACRLIRIPCHLTFCITCTSGTVQVALRVYILGSNAQPSPWPALPPPGSASSCFFIAISPKVNHYPIWVSVPVSSQHADWLIQVQETWGHLQRVPWDKASALITSVVQMQHKLQVECVGFSC